MHQFLNVNQVPLGITISRTSKKNKIWFEIESKNVMFDLGKETIFGSSYRREFRKIVGSINRDSTVQLRPCLQGGRITPIPG